MIAIYAGTPLFQETTGQEAGTAEEDSGAELLVPEIAELVWGGLAFAVLFVFMVRFAFPAFGRMLAAREAAIKADLEAAERAKAEADSLLADYRTQLAGAREDATRLIEEARAAADSVRADIVSKAEAERIDIVGRARQEINAERERAVRELNAQVGELSLDLAERVVGQSLDREAQLRLIENYINEVGGMR